MVVIEDPPFRPEVLSGLLEAVAGPGQR